MNRSSDSSSSTDQTLTWRELRATHIQLFFSIRDRLTKISRQTLFLAISIFEKFMAQAETGQLVLSEIRANVEVRVVSCLWLAWKYLESAKIPLTKLLEKVSVPLIAPS